MRNYPNSFANVMILNVGNSETTAKDHADIERAQCLNCQEPHSYLMPMTYVRLGSGQLIWWHRTAQCPVKVNKRELLVKATRRIIRENQMTV